MHTKIKATCLFVLFSFLCFTGCENDETRGPAGEDADVYYSEWVSPTEWSGGSGDWYFAVSAPDLTEDIVEEGVILAYVWLEDDLYDGSSVRPLPAYAVGANWGFLVHEYSSIEFTCDMISEPATTGNYFRFVAIPGTIPASTSASVSEYGEQEELRSMSYEEICELYDIPE